VASCELQALEALEGLMRRFLTLASGCMGGQRQATQPPLHSLARGQGRLLLPLLLQLLLPLSSSTFWGNTTGFPLASLRLCGVRSSRGIGTRGGVCCGVRCGATVKIPNPTRIALHRYFKPEPNPM
jgi:hypothetical protein